MKSISLILTTVLLCANATAAFKINNQSARNMDDVHSLGVIYINHNSATDDARQAPGDTAEAPRVKYDQQTLTRETGSNGTMHTSEAIYR